MKAWEQLVASQGGHEGQEPTFRLVVKSPFMGPASAERVAASHVGEVVDRWVREGFFPWRPGDSVTVELHADGWTQ